MGKQYRTHGFNVRYPVCAEAIIDAPEYMKVNNPYYQYCYLKEPAVVKAKARAWTAVIRPRWMVFLFGDRWQKVYIKLLGDQDVDERRFKFNTTHYRDAKRKYG